MAKRIVVTECPECGAPIDPTLIANPDNPACPFCHTMLPTADDQPAPAVYQPVYMPMSMPPQMTMPPVRRRRGLAFFWLFFSLVIVGASVGIPLAIKHAANKATGSYEVDGPVVPVSSSKAYHDDYVVAPQTGADGTVVLRRVDSNTDQIVWSTADISLPSGDPAKVVATATSVIFIAQTDVTSYSATTGRSQWQTSISNDLASRAGFEGLPGQVGDCVSGCAILIGSTLVTLAKDGTVQGFATTTGAQLWSRHLADTPDWLQPGGGYAAVVSAPKSGDDELLLFNPRSGAERSIAPSCAADSSGSSATPDDGGGFFVNPDGKTLTVLIASFSSCVATYRISDGKLLWRTAADEQNAQIPPTLTGESATGGARYLAWTNEVNSDKWIFTANLATGAVRRLYDTGSQESTVNLDGMVGDTIVVEVAPSYASEEPAIVGVSLTASRPPWKLATRVDTNNNGNQVVVVTSTGIGVVSCKSLSGDAGGTCKFEAIDPKFGTTKGPVTTTDSDILPSAEADAGPVGDVLANVDSQIAFTFDPVHGVEVGRWP